VASGPAREGCRQVKFRAGFVAALVASLAWGLVCGLLNLRPELSSLFGSVIGSSAFFAGLWWGNR